MLDSRRVLPQAPTVLGYYTPQDKCPMDKCPVDKCPMMNNHP